MLVYVADYYDESVQLGPPRAFLGFGANEKRGS